MNPASNYQPLDAAYNDFREAILALPADRFLAPMSGWSPRDVVAHLIGWNLHMIEAGKSLQRGETPGYYAQREVNYRDMNAEYVARHNSTDRDAMLAELGATLDQLQAYVRSLPPGELHRETAVPHYRGGMATVWHTLDSLTRDYEEHAREIREWQAEGG